MFRMWMKMAALGWNSQQVIALRLEKLAKGGPGAATEARLMVSEKMLEAGNAAVTLASGGNIGNVVASYHRKVRANKSRLAGR